MQLYTPKHIDGIHETYCINVVDSDGHDAKFVGLWIAWRFSCVYIPTEAAALTFCTGSTCFLRGIPAKSPWKETSRKNPKTVYDNGKITQCGYL